MHAIEVLKETRRLLASGLDGLGDRTLTEIPPGFRNSILWHAGHLVVTQQLLCYGQTGRPLLVDDGMVAAFRKGTSPEDWSETPDPDLVRRLLTELPEKLARDWEAGSFGEFASYTTTSGVVVDSLEMTLSFNAYHEGVHAGQIMAFRRMLA